MYGIVRFKMIDVVRRWKTHTKNELCDDAAMDAATADGASAELADQLDVFRQMLQEMDEPSRRILEMTKIEGLSIREVSTQLKITEGAVKVRVHRALKDLTKKVRSRIYE